MTHPLPRKSFLLALAVFLCALLLAGCAGASSQPTEPLAVAQAETAVEPTDTTVPPSPGPSLSARQMRTRRPTQTRTLYVTRTAQPTRTPSKTSTITPTPTITLTPTITPTPTATAQQVTINGYPLSVSTGIPASGEPISAANISRLAGVAQWGKGPVERMLYTPDGKSLLGIGRFGIAVYSADSFESAPVWLPFDAPLHFEKTWISEDGNYLQLSWQNWDFSNHPWENAYFSLRDQKFLLEMPDVTWNTRSDNDTDRVYSPDGKLQLRGATRWDERPNQFNHELYTGTIYDTTSGQPLFDLQDESMDVTYWDYNSPDGCDLETFSYCGNVYDPNVMLPFRAAFSPSGRRLALLYRAPNLWNSEEFSILRLYDAGDGRRLASIGSFDQPVMDFAIQPGTDRVAVAFVDGSIQVWDPEGQALLRQAWHFSPPDSRFDVTSDGRFLIVKHPGSVDVRRTSDGALAGRYEANTVALSPVENLLALGSDDGEIRVEDLDRQQTASRMEGHTARIYALVFSPDGQTLTSSSRDCSIRSWDAHTGQFQHFYEEASVNAIGEEWTESRIFVYYMQHVPGSDRLVGFGSWGTAASWNTQSGAKDYAVVSERLEYYNGMQTLNPHFPASFWVVPEEQRFYIDAVGYDLASGEPVGAYSAAPGQPTDCSVYGPVSADGSLRFTPGYGDLTGQVCVLSAADNHLMYTMPVFAAERNTVMPIQRVFLSEDGTRLFAASSAGPVFVYQVGE